MAIREIIKLPDKRLRLLSEPVKQIDAGIRKLVDDMFETMYKAPGIGLAAIQVGVAKRVITMDLSKKEDDQEPQVFINPEIISKEGRQRSSEGCLSIPEFREDVSRAKIVTVRAQDVSGKVFEHTGEDLLARAFLHETDHLNGKLYISHISAIKRDLIKRKIKKLKKEGEW